MTNRKVNASSAVPVGEGGGAEGQDRFGDPDRRSAPLVTTTETPSRLSEAPLAFVTSAGGVLTQEFVWDNLSDELISV